MAKKHRKVTLWKKIRFKYKFTILNENTLEDVFVFKLSGLNAILTILAFAFFLIAMTAIVIINTPIRNYLPGYMNSEIRKDIVYNNLRADSLELVVEMQTNYLNNLVSVLKGEDIQKPVVSKDLKKDSSIIMSKSKEEEAFLSNYEEQEKYNLSSLPASGIIPDNVIFFRPARGVISSKYDVKEKHYGVDIASNLKESVLATLSGTVVFTGFDASAGYVIQLQHKNGLMSIYKHNTMLLKKMGDEVVAGEAIALVGNTGKLSTGPHLHFEIWVNGFPVDPESVIIF